MSKHFPLFLLFSAILGCFNNKYHCCAKKAAFKDTASLLLVKENQTECNAMTGTAVQLWEQWLPSWELNLDDGSNAGTSRPG